MTRGWLRGRLLLAVVTSAALAPATAAARPQHPAGPVPPDQTTAPAGPATETLPVDLDRIRRALARPDTVSVSVERYAAERGRPVFRVEVEGEWPSFAAFVGEGESLRGPAPWGPMTHAEFLTLVTPPQARAWGASTNGDLLQLLVTSLAANLALQRATAAGVGLVQGVRNAIRSSQERAAREEVLAVLAELERRRQEAEAQRRAQETDPPEALAPRDPPKPPELPPA